MWQYKLNTISITAVEILVPYNFIGLIMVSIRILQWLLMELLKLSVFIKFDIVTSVLVVVTIIDIFIFIAIIVIIVFISIFADIMISISIGLLCF